MNNKKRLSFKEKCDFIRNSKQTNMNIEELEKVINRYNNDNKSLKKLMISSCLALISIINTILLGEYVLPLGILLSKISLLLIELMGAIEFVHICSILKCKSKINKEYKSVIESQGYEEKNYEILEEEREKSADKKISCGFNPQKYRCERDSGISHLGKRQFKMRDRRKN